MAASQALSSVQSAKVRHENQRPQLQPLARRRPLQESPEFLGRKAGIANDATHGVGIHRIVSRDGENAAS